MTKWEKVELGDVCSFLSGFAFDSKYFNESDQGMPLIRIRNVLPGTTSTYYSGDYDEKYVISKGDVLIGMDGEFNIAKWNDTDALLNQRVCKICCDTRKLCENYAFHYLPIILKKIEDKTPFVTVKHLSVKKLTAAPIPLPPLSEQRRLAAILDEADAIRKARAESLRRLDELVKSTFLDMFGDPVLRGCLEIVLALSLLPKRRKNDVVKIEKIEYYLLYVF